MPTFVRLRIALVSGLAITSLALVAIGLMGCSDDTAGFLEGAQQTSTAVANANGGSDTQDALARIGNQAVTPTQHRRELLLRDAAFAAHAHHPEKKYFDSPAFALCVSDRRRERLAAASASRAAVTEQCRRVRARARL